MDHLNELDMDEAPQFADALSAASGTAGAAVVGGRGSSPGSGSGGADVGGGRGSIPLVTAGGWSGERLGRYLRRSLGAPREVDVVFCPGMGNGRRHEDHVWSFWGALRIWFRQWHTFASGGQEFNSYQLEPAPRTHPCGLPVLDRAKVEELKALIANRAEEEPPVVLLGFSAGAYLALTAARELRAEGLHRRRLGLIALGHSLFPVDRWEPPCDVPGIVVVGEKELVYAPFLQDLSGRAEDEYCAESGRYVDLGKLPGGVLMDEVGAPEAFGGCAGSSAELYHLERSLPGCLVFEARDCTHRVSDYAWALRSGRLRQVTGPAFASTRSCSTGSSLTSRSEVRSLSS